MNKRQRKKQNKPLTFEWKYEGFTVGRFSCLAPNICNLPKNDDCMSQELKMITVVYPGADGIGPDVYEEDV